MKQDIEFNVWVLISSILQTIVGIACIGAGSVLAVMGMIDPFKLLKIEEINFLVTQEGFIKLQNTIFGGVLIKKYLFMIIGAIIAIAGLISLIFAIVELLYVKRYKVVNHRVALIFFAMIPLAIAICVEAYLLIEYDILNATLDHVKNVRIVCFAICGIFSG